jgi:large subunit ribosomal protein L14
VQIIGVKGAKAKKARYPKVGIGDVVIVAVKKGNASMRKKVLKAVIIRQKKAFRRPNGVRISFEDNACVIIDDQGLPVGTEIKGVIAREVATRFPKVAAIAPSAV